MTTPITDPASATAPAASEPTGAGFTSFRIAAQMPFNTVLEVREA